MRWQIALAFKRLKSLIGVDKLPARGSDLARAWLAAHLIREGLGRRPTKSKRGLRHRWAHAAWRSIGAVQTVHRPRSVFRLSRGGIAAGCFVILATELANEGVEGGGEEKAKTGHAQHPEQHRCT